MKQKTYVFSGKTVAYYFSESLERLSRYADPQRTILIVDDQVDRHHAPKLAGWRKIVVRGEEASKDLSEFQRVIRELIRLEADRKTLLVGIGGGVVTDLTGFVGSVYMRGVPYGFVPSTLLSQVDASIGGKNGVNFGDFKNMLGVIRQPEFLLFDQELLATLPEEEWRNGFAEVIKSGLIADAALFAYLETHREAALAHDPGVISHLVEVSADIKSTIVGEDEFEQGRRRLLNFGHTVGHAVEKLEGIPHGQAVAKGMGIATSFSCRLAGLPAADAARIMELIREYRLPLDIKSDPERIVSYFRMDKKRERQAIHFILLEGIGSAFTQSLPLTELDGLVRDALRLPAGKGSV